MYNVFQYNETNYNAVSSNILTSIDEDYVYNGYGLQNDVVIITNSNFDNSHSIQSNTFARPLSDGGGELNYFFREKVINLEGYIKASNAEELNNEIDRMKRILLKNNQDLDIKVNGTVRRGKASLLNGSSLFDRQNYHITFLPFLLEFRALEKFKETRASTTTFTGLTGNFIEEVYNEGTANALQSFTFVINSASGVNETSITIGGETITISQELFPFDILVIDSDEKTVKLNDVEIDYLGVFGELGTGLQPFSVEVNGVVNFDFTIKYFNTYL